MYQYIATQDSPISIDTPFCNNLSDVKKEILSQSEECTHIRSTYANGFVVEMIQLADKIIFETNRELVDNGNGKFTAPDK